MLLSKKDQSGAAKYYLEAAHSGKYPKDYKFAADIYFNEHNMGQVEAILNDLAKSPSNPDAQWASYMRYKLPRGTLGSERDEEYAGGERVGGRRG